MSKAKGIKRILHTHTTKTGRVSHVEGPIKGLHNEDGSLTAKGLNALRAALNSPIQHTTVDLGIKEFKRFLKRIPMMTKSLFNQQVREYKDKGWGEYAKTIKFKGSFPTVSR
jgi:hypothetical protein